MHVSVAGGVDRAVFRALERGCDSFQIFSSNPRGWRSNPIQQETIERFIAQLSQSGLSPAVDHMPYLPNIASARNEVYARSVQALVDELERCHILGIPYLVTHLGSHLGAGRKEGLTRIADALKTATASSGSHTTLLMENSAGTKNSMASTFSEMAEVLDLLPEETRRLGVCLDTCHLHAAGYDLRDPQALRATLDQFQEEIGLQSLKLIHLNDCRGSLGAHLDRHEHIGLGQIGLNGFAAILSHPALKGLPMILETPVDSRRDDRGNLEVARRLASGIK